MDPVLNSIDGIKIIDATLRDGGLVNDFRFTDDFVRALYNANISAGVDYMEFGYRADKKQFDENKFGKWKFSSDKDIRAVIGDGNPSVKISVMVDVGRCDYKNDISKKSESPVDLFRVATYIDTVSEAAEMIEHICSLGYDATCNIMAISKCSDLQISDALRLLSKTPVMAVYIVDSYGALYPQQIRHLTDLYKDILSPAGKLVGIHAHNNQQCAFTNTVESKLHGATLLDGTAYGMGRGAGNCFLEQLLGVLNGQKYNVEPLLDFVEKYMYPLKSSGIEWGYNTSYMLTGLTNQHPRTAIAATKNKEINYREQYKILSYE